MSPQTPQLVDAKRAAALVVHWNRQDVDGVNEVLAQVNGDEDPNAATARLLFAIIELYSGIMPALHTPRGLTLLSQMVVDLSLADLDEQQ